MVNEVRGIYFKKCDSRLVQEFLLQIRFFRDSLFDRLPPVFDDMENEADVKANLSSSLCEYEESIEWFIRTSNVKQSMLNLYVVAIFHLFEQQIFVLVRTLLRDTSRQAKFNKDIKVIVESNININNFKSFEKVEELKLVCDAVKHAEGRSSSELSLLRPDLMRNPTLLDLPCIDLKCRLSVLQPLSGEDIFIQPRDIEEYMDTIEEFWNQFIEVLDQL